MKAEGIDIVSFAAGEPDFNTPEPIVKSAIDALERGFTKYTPTSGIKELKEAIVSKLIRENQLKVDPSQIVVSCGAKQSLFQTMQVLVNPGDEVILIAPYWMTYADQIITAGGVPVIVHTQASTGFQPDIDAIKAAVTNKTKAILVNSPSNPTGAVYPREMIKQIAALALRHGFWIITDEIYERLIYSGAEHQCIAALGQEVAAQTITIGGCSKTYSMTGWRIGFADAPPAVATLLSSLQDQLTSNPTSFAQRGAVTAFNLESSQVEKMRAEFEGRRDLIVSLLQAIPGVKLVAPQGAFYALPDFSALLGPKYPTDEALATFLLDEAKVAVIPGSVFEAKGHIRLSYATSRTQIEKGVARIQEALTGVTV